MVISCRRNGSAHVQYAKGWLSWTRIGRLEKHPSVIIIHNIIDEFIWNSLKLYIPYSFRLAVFDHGLFSFTDVHHNSWPIVIVTNPKHAMFRIPQKENVNLSLSKHSLFGVVQLWISNWLLINVYFLYNTHTESTHIRVLGFSPDGIANCTVSINYEASVDCVKMNDNLFVVKWNPKLYQKGVHTIAVHMIDGVGRETKVRIWKIYGKRILTRLPEFSFVLQLWWFRKHVVSCFQCVCKPDRNFCERVRAKNGENFNP